MMGDIQLASDRRLEPRQETSPDYHADMTTDEVVSRYTDLVYKVAHQLKTRLTLDVPLEDLVAYGQGGLLEAHQRFDGDQNVSFSTYAFYRIRGAIIDGCRDGAWVVRDTECALGDLAALNAFLENCTAVHEPQALPKSFESSVSHVVNLVGDAGMVVLLNSMSRLEEDTPPEAHQRLVRRDQCVVLRQAVKEVLTDEERHIIEGHYFENRSMSCLGDEMGYSKSWICRIKARAVGKLRMFFLENDIDL